MKILHVVPTYYPAVRYGGPIVSIHELCKSLVFNGNKVTVLTTNVDGKNNLKVDLCQPVNIDGVIVYYYPTLKILRRIYWSWLMFKDMRSKILEHDIVHLHSVFLWPTLHAARKAIELNKPYIVSPRGMLVKDLIIRKNFFAKYIWLNLFEIKTLKYSKYIHVTSEIEKNEFLKFNYKYKNIVNIPNGTNINFIPSNQKNVFFDEMHGLPNEYILFLGRINWKKGIDRIIYALKYMKDTNLIIAGNDEEEYTAKLKEIAKKIQVIDRIFFIGPIYGVKKLSIIKNAKILVLTSYSENFGNVVIEAMSLGVPVAVSKEVGISYEVTKSNCGRIVSGIPEKLAEDLIEMIKDKDLLYEMGENGIKTVFNEYNWNNIAIKMHNTYKRMLD